MSSQHSAFDTQLNSGLVATLDLATHVYELDKPQDQQSPPPAGWEIHKTFGMELQYLDSAVVDSAAIYINKALGEACYVCRGSHTFVDWVVDDFGFVAPEFFLKFTTLSLIPHELPRVNNAAQNIREMVEDPVLSDYTKFVAGHSLGGYVVKAAAIFHGLKLPVVSLNGPGWFEYPIIGYEQGNILEVTNSADIVGNYRNKCANELYVNTGDDLNQRSFWGVINPIVGTAEMGVHFKGAHGLEHIRAKVAALTDGEIPLSLFNGQSNARLKKLFADRSTFLSLRLADVDIAAMAGEATPVSATRVEHSIQLHDGRVTLATSMELATAGARQLQLRYSDGSGECLLASIDPEERRTITFPIAAEDGGEPRIGPGTVSSNAVPSPFTTHATTDEKTMNLRDQIWLLHGSSFDPLPQTFNAAFALFIKMPSHPNALFFAKACAATGPESGHTLALMFGEWLEVPEALQAGDLVLFNSPFVSDGESWGVLAERMPEGTHKVLYPNKKTYCGEYLRDLPVSLVRGWRPAYSQSLKEESAAGRFWGPLMSRLRGYVETVDGAIDEDGVLRAIAAPGGEGYESISDFVQRHEKELETVADQQVLPCGSVVLTSDQKGIGVYLNNHRVLGVRQHGEAPDYWPLSRFGAAKFWMPR